MQFIDGPHELQVVITHSYWLIVIAAPGQLEQLALSTDTAWV